jgi:formamidopyrimidine-DNA glycosylase
MPELPDVEMQRIYLQSTSLNRRIQDVQVRSTYILKGVSPARLRRTLAGSAFAFAQRHGKYLLVVLEPEGCLVLHLGMDGSLRYCERPKGVARHDQMSIDFEGGGHLVYESVRKLGQIRLERSAEAFVRRARLGPDALDPGLDAFGFRSALGAGRARIKSALMDQRRLAGIGNLYADEILYQAGVHPGTRLCELDDAEVQALYEKTRGVLDAAIRAHADIARLPDGFLLPVRRIGGCCPRDGAPLTRIRISGRTTYYCLAHQVEKKGPVQSVNKGALC